jgi:16S rRNA (adenine1518-N6/adenine1519-N6)-dimethyltransferase
VTLLLGYWAEVRPCRELPPGAFTPPPKVSSTIIDITRRSAPLGAPREYSAFAYWVRRLFSQRRKQIGGILRRDLGEDRAARAIEWCRMSPCARAEDLPAELYLALARHAPVAASEGECREASS